LVFSPVPNPEGELYPLFIPNLVTVNNDNLNDRWEMGNSVSSTGVGPDLQPLGSNRFRNGFLPKQLAHHKSFIGHSLL